MNEFIDGGWMNEWNVVFYIKCIEIHKTQIKRQSNEAIHWVVGVRIANAKCAERMEWMANTTSFFTIGFSNIEQIKMHNKTYKMIFFDTIHINMDTLSNCTLKLPYPRNTNYKYHTSYTRGECTLHAQRASKVQRA